MMRNDDCEKNTIGVVNILSHQNLTVCNKRYKELINWLKASALSHS